MSREEQSRVLRRLIIKSSRTKADADAASLALAAQTEHYEEHLNKLDKFRSVSRSRAKQTSEVQLWIEELTYLQRQRGRLEKGVSSHMREFILSDPSFFIPSDVMDSIQRKEQEIGLIRQIAEIRDIFRQWTRKSSKVEKDHNTIVGELLHSCRNNIDEAIRQLSVEESILAAEVGKLRQMVTRLHSYAYPAFS